MWREGREGRGWSINGVFAECKMKKNGNKMIIMMMSNSIITIILITISTTIIPITISITMIITLQYQHY